MNVRSAWEQGVTGRNVVVTILDDGIEKDHPDLMDNYVCRKGGGGGRGGQPYFLKQLIFL